MMTGERAQTIALYRLIRYPFRVTETEIARINSHPQPDLLYQAMLTQSHYPQMFIDNPTHFIALTNPLCNPVIVLRTLIERNHLPAPGSPASIPTESNSPTCSTTSTVLFATPPLTTRELNPSAFLNPKK